VIVIAGKPQQVVHPVGDDRQAPSGAFLKFYAEIWF